MSSEAHAYTLEKLREGREHGACSEHIMHLDAMHRDVVINTLAFERLERKNRDIYTIYKSVEDDWNQTFLVMLLRVIGGTENRYAFEQLARRVPYHVIMRENAAVINIEALLLGASGLLDLYDEDEYIATLRDIFNHYTSKYNIKPMSFDSWQLTRIYPANHPTLRIVQIAGCLHNDRLSMHSATMCQRRQQVYELLESKASSYWLHHFSKNTPTQIAPRIGRFKSDIIAINLVAQMQYAYGSYIQNDAMIDRAIQLLEDIPAEENRYMKLWQERTSVARNAYESQALLQLTTEYCIKGRCAECPLAQRLIELH